MRVLLLLSACVAAALAHGVATTPAPAQPSAISGGTGTEAVRTEPTLRAGASVSVGGHGHGHGGGLGGGRYGRGWGYGGGLGFGRFGGGWVYPGAMEQVVVQPADYGYGIGGAGYYGAGYGGGIGTTIVQQPPQVVVAQPPQVVYTQAAPPETAVVPSSTFVASAAPAGGYVATAAAPASTTSISTTTATQPGAGGYIATAPPPPPPTVIAGGGSASYVTADSMVPGLQYASPYFFGAGSPVVYSRYLGGPTSWYGLRGSRFGRRFGRGVFGVYPYGYGSGGMMYTMGGGGSILGNILGGVTGDIVPPIYVGGRIGGGFGGRFGGRHGGRRHLEKQPQTATGAGQGQAQALHQIGDVQSLVQSPQVVYTQAAPPETAIVPGSTFVAAAAPAAGNAAQNLPTTTIASTNPRADIMREPAPASAEPQKPQALKSVTSPMGFRIVDSNVWA